MVFRNDEIEILQGAGYKFRRSTFVPSSGCNRS